MMPMTSALPAFDQLRPENVAGALDAVLTENRAALARLLDGTTPNWDTLIEPLDDLNENLSRVWGPVSHLFGVMSSPEWRAAYNAGLPKVTEYSLELSQNEALFRVYESLSRRADFMEWSPARRKVITDALRDFRLSGIALPPEQQARFKAIALRLSELHAQFEEHIMDCVQAWSLLIAEESQLDGMTDDAKTAARAKAQAKGEAGWLLTLDYPSFDAVITKATNRNLRECLYTAYATRASDQGGHAAAFDNTALILEIGALRQEEAQLLGFAHFADLSLATKMAESVDEVEQFLLNLAHRARPQAQRELAQLRELAAADGVTELQPWDTAFYSERLRERTLGLSDETLRPYFPFPQVVQGLFDLIEQLYGVTFSLATDMPVWHADVQTWTLSREGQPFARCYLDPYARPESKRGGAWMDECQGRRKTTNGSLQMPVAYLVCNFTPPLPGQPALLTHDDVLTLFHEFGHGLHHLLTQVDEAAVSGIRGVAWDAVELPSQFMENWCYEPDTLKRFARHWQTGETLPDALIRQLRADRVFQTGLATLRQVEFALFDLRLHRNGGDALRVLAQVRDEVALLQPPAWNRMPWSFSHIFAGGYAAGYYSYKWAEVLSSDAFAAFEEAQFSPQVGQRFRDTILAQGGSREAMDLFVAFRGRKPSIESLLRHSGL